jgi:hypothetical protein
MFRAYNPNADFHFFTTSFPQFNNAVAAGYQDEATSRAGFAVYTEQESGSTPLFRLYNLERGFHYYTANATEKAFLLSLNPPQGDPNFGSIGWRDEGVEGYIFTSAQPGTTTIYRLYNNVSGVHLFTESQATRNAILSQFPGIWVEHANLGFAFAITGSNTLAGSGGSGAARSASLQSASALGTSVSSAMQETRTAFSRSVTASDQPSGINVASALSTADSTVDAVALQTAGSSDIGVESAAVLPTTSTADDSESTDIDALFSDQTLLDLMFDSI